MLLDYGIKCLNLLYERSVQFYTNVKYFQFKKTEKLVPKRDFETKTLSIILCSITLTRTPNLTLFSEVRRKYLVSERNFCVVRESSCRGVNTIISN